jgi:Fe-S cluster assembly protein SufD
MNTAKPNVEHFHAQYSRVAEKLIGDRHGALAALRNRAMQAFTASGFPTIRDEDWKYTNVHAIAQQEFALSEPNQQLPEGLLESLRYSDLDCYEMVFINGHFAAAHSSLSALPDGLTLHSLSGLGGADTDQAIEKLGSAVGAKLSGFVALNTAFISDGVYLQLRSDTVLDKPVHLLFISTANAQPQVSHPRILIVAGVNSQAQIIEHYAAEEGSRNLSNSVTEIIAGEGAQIEHCKVQVESLQGYHVGKLYIKQQKDSQVTSHSVALGARLSRTDIDASLEASGAIATMNGLYMVRGRQHVDHHTRVDHLQPNTHSNEYYKGILDGHARGVFNGKVVVHKDAQKIEAHQHNRNLLLSDNAEIDTKPELEIYADDVKCSHGATVGQLDENALFYLRSRGIGEHEAINLLTFGFADDVISLIKIPAVRARLEAMVISQLPDNENLKELL